MDTVKKIPVILDTDPGTDIDDQWAIALLLRSPELDVKLITGSNGDTTMRCDLIARLLKAANCTDIAVAAGRNYKADEIRNYLDLYLQHTATPRGKYPDAAHAIVDTINHSAEPVTLITIAPLTNIADALKLDKSIAEKTDFIGMQGSLFRGANGNIGREKEWNLFADDEASKLVYNQVHWHSMTITPLDTCGYIRFDRAFLERMEAVDDPLVQELLEQHRWWLSGIDPKNYPGERAIKWPEETTSFFDTVAVHLAYSTAFLEMKNFRLRATNGMFVDDEEALNDIAVAVEWRDKAGFRLEFEKRLTKSLN